MAARKTPVIKSAFAEAGKAHGASSGDINLLVAERDELRASLNVSLKNAEYSRQDAEHSRCAFVVAQKDIEFWRSAENIARETLRDHLAMHALTGILTHGTHHTHEKVMEDAYKHADAGMVVRCVVKETVVAEPTVVVVPPAGPGR